LSQLVTSQKNSNSASVSNFCTRGKSWRKEEKCFLQHQDISISCGAIGIFVSGIGLAFVYTFM